MAISKKHLRVIFLGMCVEQLYHFLLCFLSYSIYIHWVVSTRVVPVATKGGFPLIFPSAGTGTERTETNNKI